MAALRHLQSGQTAAWASERRAAAVHCAVNTEQPLHPGGMIGLTGRLEKRMMKQYSVDTRLVELVLTFAWPHRRRIHGFTHLHRAARGPQSDTHAALRHAGLASRLALVSATNAALLSYQSDHGADPAYHCPAGTRCFVARSSAVPKVLPLGIE